MVGKYKQWVFLEEKSFHYAVGDLCPIDILTWGNSGWSDRGSRCESGLVLFLVPASIFLTTQATVVRLCTSFDICN